MSAGRDEKGTKMKMVRAMLAALALAGAGQACALGKLAQLSIYDRAQGVQLPVYWYHGRAYVVGRPGNEYQIVLKSRSGEDLLAVVSVDGVNAVSGETADPGQAGYVLSGYRSYEILGWRKSLAETAAFYFTSLGDSYAARTGRPDNVGVIGVALFRRKPQVPPPANLGLAQGAPASAAKREASDAAPRAAEQEARVGTGHGRRETSPVRQVDFERASDAPAETLAIYYDSYRNLVARGVIVDPIALPPLPRPFPGFVPDPRG
jgi:hypothetical protein